MDLDNDEVCSNSLQYNKTPIIIMHLIIKEDTTDAGQQEEC